MDDATAHTVRHHVRRSLARLSQIGLAAGLAASFLSLPVRAQSPCPEPAARAVSIEGRVEFKTRSSEWSAVRLDQPLCAGDMVRVLEHSRAGLTLRNDILLRLDQNTVLTVGEAHLEQPTVLELVRGWLHVITRHRKQFRVTTPFVNAVVEGTEFTVSVEAAQSAVLVTEGRVRMENARGRLALDAGQAGLARDGAEPIAYLQVRPRDAVQWALYFPPVLRYAPQDGDPAEREAARLAAEGDPTGALERLAAVPVGERSAQSQAFEASLLLSVGRVDQARAVLDLLEARAGASADVLALRAIIALTTGERALASQLAARAVQSSAPSAAAWIAQSYVQQAEFKLDNALASAQRATAIDPQNAIAWSRVAELQLSLGEVRGAREAAQRAVQLGPRLGSAHTILGYIQLREGRPAQALGSFQSAIALAQADPLPRLGEGIAKIRQGKLPEGRRDVEIAALLDPDNSLVRSYLGKAYFDEYRDRLAGTEFELAKSLDPLDPTPWFYDAIRKQTENRPGEALEDLQRSIALNDNRAVYRSRLLLDQDAAARAANLARIYEELGFDQLAVSEGLSALNTDPASFSAHRFVADAYQPLPRYDIARTSEVLQSQLLQPAGAAPFPPRVGQARAPIVEGEGPLTPSFQELNPLFNRDRNVFFLSGVAGENNTLGDEAMFALVRGNQALRLGQFYYQTDGFRPGADLTQQSYDVFYQNDLTWSTSVQAEVTFGSIDNGDITQRINSDYAPLTFDQSIDDNNFRLGLRHAASADAQWLVSLARRSQDISQQASSEAFPGDPTVTTDSDVSTDELAYQGELQYLRRIGRLDLVAGLGIAYVPSDNHVKVDLTFQVPPPPLSFPLLDTTFEGSQRYRNIYGYGSWKLGRGVTLVTGLSFDHYVDTNAFTRDQWNPKLGLLWNVSNKTTVRLAGFRYLKRPFASNQTIEPTQVAGFNQFFDDVDGTDAWRVGAAVDHRFSERVFAGLEVSYRDLEVPIRELTGGLAGFEDQTEQLYRGYVSVLLSRQLSFSAGLAYDDQSRDIPDDLNDFLPHRVATVFAPLALTWHHPSGVFASIGETFVDQRVDQNDPVTNALTTIQSRFALTDVSIGYRLPKRWGVISLEVRNLFDQDFGYQDTNLFGTPRIPLFQPGRTVLLRFSLYH